MKLADFPWLTTAAALLAALVYDSALAQEATPHYISPIGTLVAWLLGLL